MYVRGVDASGSVSGDVHGVSGDNVCGSGLAMS